MENHIYTYVIHSLKNHLKLSDNEYYVLDTIDFLSQKREWCYKSKKNIATDIFITEKTVNNAIKRLLNLGLIQKDISNSRNLKPTLIWFQLKEKFKNKIGATKAKEAENISVKGRKPKNSTTKNFPKTPKEFRTRKIEEEKIEDKELNRKLDQLLNFKL